MPLAALPRAFKMILTTLKKLEISHLGDEMTHVKIWVLLSFSYNFIYLFIFPQILYKMALVTLPRAFKRILKNHQKFEICHASA